MAKMNSLEELFMHELQDIYDAEQQITQALPNMAQATSSQELRQAFELHLGETQQQIQRLEQVFNQMGMQPQGRTCQAMKGLITECQDLMQEKADPAVMDAGLIASAQKVEHYEIAAYGTLRTWASRLGQNEVVTLLQQTLDEEGKTDKELTRLAEQLVNIQAAEG